MQLFFLHQNNLGLTSKNGEVSSTDTSPFRIKVSVPCSNSLNSPSNFFTRERAEAESAAAAEREEDERQAQQLQQLERQRQEEQRRRIQVRLGPVWAGLGY